MELGVELELGKSYGWMAQLAICLAQPAIRELRVVGGWHSRLYAWHSRLYGGGPCDYCVSPSPNNWLLGFFRLGLNLGS